MQLHLLGTGGYHPSEERHTACFLLPESGVMLDAGTATFRVARHLQRPELDIFLSHAHLDHIVGLTTLVGPMITGQLKSVRVHAKPDVIAAIRTHLFSFELFPVQPAFEFIPLEQPRIQVGPVTIDWQTLPSHPGTTTGYRLTWPAPDGMSRSLAYITDTTVDGSYTGFVTGADLLIHECYFPDRHLDWARLTGHSTTSQVLGLARDAGIKRLVLTHVDPVSEGPNPLEIPDELDGLQVSVARDQMRIDLSHWTIH